MAHPATALQRESFRSPEFVDHGTKNEASASAVSWAAVFAGAFVAAAISLILLALGTGIGLSSVSPWSSGSSTSAVTKTAIIWLVLSQIMASCMGGYLAGRLRTKWVSLHTDEVYFRDTAHGFVVWAVGLVIMAAFLASAATSMVGRVAEAGATSQFTVDPAAYYVDALFRSDAPAAADQNDAPIRAEAEGIFANDLRRTDAPTADNAYLAKLVATRTGLSQGDAENRVNAVFAQARQEADAARKSAAHLAYWTFFALLVGAFCASFSATLGGRERDLVAH